MTHPLSAATPGRPGTQGRVGTPVLTWRDFAACSGIEPELFFPVGTTGAALGQIDDAKRVCGRCVVQRPCLTWAMATGTEHGVWGGLSERERRTLRQRAQVQGADHAVLVAQQGDGRDAPRAGAGGQRS